MLIGILQTGQSPEALKASLGDYPDLFQILLKDYGFRFRTYHVEAMEFPADVHDCDGWLITGSRHGVYEDHAFIAPLEAFIRKAYSAPVPMAGICFGHQIIAQALGGKVERFAGGWAIGPQDYDFAGETLRLNAWHQDQVTQCPPDAKTVGSNSFCRYAALAYGDQALTFQAHPEFPDAFIQGLIDHRGRGTLPDAILDAAEAGMGRGTASGVIARQIAEFFQAAGRAKAAAADATSPEETP